MITCYRIHHFRKWYCYKRFWGDDENESAFLDSWIKGDIMEESHVLIGFPVGPLAAKSTLNGLKF